MARLRGPLRRPLEGEAGWPLLNERVFGDTERGGHDVVPLPDVLPMDWHAVFGRDVPRTLEIGTNRGRFLRELAVRQPERDHVGVEIRRRHAFRVAHEMGLEGGPRNCRILWADAKLAAPALFAPASVADLFILFPDPWWKSRHVKRRLVDDETSRALIDLVTIGGSIWVKSDVAHIADEIVSSLAQMPGLSGPIDFDQETLPLSHRERRCLQEGLPIRRFRFERVA